MTIEPLQLTVTVLAVIGWVAAYLRWVRPLRNHGAASQGLLLLVSLVFLGGFWGAFFWWFPETGIFGWKLPLLASRMLAGAGWAFALVSYAALRTKRAANVRFVLIWLVVYLLPLAVVAPLWHLDRFDFTRFIVYPFFIIVVGMSVAATWFLVRKPWPLSAAHDDVPAADRATSVWFVIVAVVMAAWGLALFVTDKGPSPALWIWPGDALTTRLIAAMLFTIAVGCLLARRDQVLAALMLGAIFVYGTSAVVANLVNALAGRPFKSAYIAVFGVMALVSAVLWLQTRALQNSERII